MVVKIKKKQSKQSKSEKARISGAEALDKLTELLSNGPEFKILGEYKNLTLIATSQANVQYKQFIAPIIAVLKEAK